MSHLSPNRIAITESYYRVTPNRQLGSTSKKYVVSQLAESLSPEKTSYLNRLHDSTYVLDRELNSIKFNMENSYKQEADKLMFESKQLDENNNALENELRRINQQIINAKNNQSVTLKDKDLQRQLVDRIAHSQIDHIKNESHQKMDQLQFEIERIKEQLHGATLKSNEYRRKATEFESRSLLLSRSEHRLREYEEKLGNLNHEIHAKQNEIDNVRGQIAVLQLKGGDILILEREIQNLKNIQEYKERENAELLNRKSVLETEIFKNQQNERAARANEIELLKQAENLKTQIVNIENQKNQEIFQKSKHYENQINLNEKTHQIEIDRLSLQLSNLESELNLKSQQLDNIRLENNQIQNSLLAAHGRAQSAEKNASTWGVRASSAEIEKERETRIHRAIREQAVDSTIKQHSTEKIALDSQANHLHHSVVIKDNELNATRQSLVNTEIKKSVVEGNNAALKNSLIIEHQRLDNSREKYIRESRNRDIVHESSLERLRIEHNAKRVQLEDQINALRSLVDVKRRELDEANRRGVVVSTQLAHTELKKSQADATKNFWNHKAVEIERVKNSQIIAHEQLKNNQINALRNSHAIDMNIKERDNLSLSFVYENKDRDNLNLRLSNAELNNKVREVSVEKINALNDSDIWRNKAIETDLNRVHNNIHHNNLRNSLIHNTELHHSIEKNSLINTANLASSINVSSAIEANNLRNSYNALAVSSLSPVKISHSRIPSALPILYRKY